MSDIFVNLSAEYPALLNIVFIIFAGAGVFISASAALDVMKLGDKNNGAQTGGAGSIFAKMIGGSLMIDLSFWAHAFGESLWSYSSPLGIDSYSASNGSSDMGQTALMAVIGFIVIAGYVVLGKAYWSMTRLGYLSPEARGDLIGNIISRVVAGTAMIACLHISRALEESMGINWMPG